MHLDRLKTLWPEIEPLLDQLLELDEPERTALLDRALAGSPETRRVVESLLRADRDAGDRFARPVTPPAALPADAGAAIAPGTHIGAYVVRSEIGRGGMGAVLLAERDDGQFTQRVAIKLVRSDAWDPAARERFVLERRILARLQHPNIARLLDGGVREDGAPFLVMEYVEGLPITAWCDQRRLDLRARLVLFRQVCAAVEYAHSQLVVHRDLKPDNILVNESGDVKLLDFGIAKLLEPTGAAAMTGTHGRIFTPAYVAPEQYTGVAVTVATDEYQLALVLFELLTGQRVHGDTTATPLQHQRRVLDTDAPRPSRSVQPAATTRAGAGPPRPAAQLEAAAAARTTTVPALGRALAGDLDAIVLKALEREPEHRYPSVETFRRDLENVLEDRPVAARTATAGYRVRKYVRRHRRVLGAAALVLLSLAGGLVGVQFQARIAAHERDLARESERKATAINDFVLRELLESPTPERALGRPLTVAEVLSSASRTIDHAFPDQPLTEAAVRMTLARSYQALGQLDAAHEHAERARRLIERRLPPDARERLEARELLAELAFDRGDLDEAEGAFRTLATDHARMQGETDPATLLSRGQLGRVLDARGRFVAADSVLVRALAALPPPGDTPWRLAVDLRRWLAGSWADQGRATAAESLLRQSLAIERRHLGSDHPLIAATMRQLADALDHDLRRAEAGAVLDDVLRMSIRLNGEDHPATGDAYLTLATNLDSRLRHGEALDAITHAAAIYARTLGTDHPKTLRALRNRAVLLRGAHQFAAADSIYRQVAAASARTLGPEHRLTLETLKGLAYLRIEEHRMADAREIAHGVIATYQRIAARPDADPTVLSEYALYLVEADPPQVRDPRRAVAVARRSVAATARRDYLALRTLGFAAAAAGEPRLAADALRAALALPDGVRSWTTEQKLVDVLEAHGAPGELERTLLEHLADERRVRGGDDRYAGKTLRLLSRYYHAAGADTTAERYARAALAQLRKTLPAQHWEVGRAEADLGALLVDRGASAEAESLLVRGFRALEGDPEVPRAELETARESLVRLYERTRRDGAARAWRTRVFAPRWDADR